MVVASALLSRHVGSRHKRGEWDTDGCHYLLALALVLEKVSLKGANRKLESEKVGCVSCVIASLVGLRLASLSLVSSSIVATSLTRRTLCMCGVFGGFSDEAHRIGIPHI